MKRAHLLAVFASLAVIIAFTADASAYYHPTVGRFLQRDPGPSGPARVGASGPAVGGGFIQRDQHRDGMNVHPVKAMPPDPMAPPVLFDPTGQHPDGPNLYQYVRSNPVRWQDPKGTDIYIRGGHDTWDPVKALHRQVCADTWVNGKKTEELTCFSYQYIGWKWRWYSSKWLGWGGYTVFAGYLMEGIIYQDNYKGEIVQQKKSTCRQDRAWVFWMMQSRLGTRDAYGVAGGNCRKYSELEYNDAPGDHPDPPAYWK